MPDKCTQQFGPATHRTVALAIELVGATTANAHQIVAKVLEDKKIQKKLAEELKKAGDELMAEQTRGKPLSLTDTTSKLGSTTTGILKDPTIKQIKGSKEFLRLESSMQRLQCAFDETPVGAFVNDNKTLLVVVGAVAAVAGGVAMVHTKAGDVPAHAYKLIPLLIPKKIGSVDVSLKSLQLQQSTRTVGAEMAVSKKWQRVQAAMELKFTFVNQALAQGGGSGNLVLTLSPEWEGSASTKFSWTKATAEARKELMASGELGVRRKLSRDTNLSVQLFGKYLDGEKGISRQMGAKANLEMNNAVGRGTKLTVSPSLTSTKENRLHEGALTPTRTDNRFMLGVALHFD